jgi:hypothetical protein
MIIRRKNWWQPSSCKDPQVVCTEQQGQRSTQHINAYSSSYLVTHISSIVNFKQVRTLVFQTEFFLICLRDWLCVSLLLQVSVQGQRFSNCGAPSGGWAVGPLRALELYVWGTYLFWTKYGRRQNIYFGRHFVWLKCFTYQSVPVLAPNYKQHTVAGWS